MHKDDNECLCHKAFEIGFLCHNLQVYYVHFFNCCTFPSVLVQQESRNLGSEEREQICRISGRGLEPVLLGWVER